MRVHRVSRGFDIPIAGAPRSTIVDAAEPPRVAAQVDGLRGLRLRPVVHEQDYVAAGAPVLVDRDVPDLRIAAPASGRVVRVDRARPLIEIARDGTDDEAVGHEVLPLALTDRAALTTALRRSGLWPLLRQRPLGRVPTTEQPPAALFVNGMDSEPLAASPARLVDGRDADLQAGLDVLGRLCDGATFLAVAADAPLPSAFADARGVELHAFAGPHPAGLVGTHIDRIAPLREGQIAWSVRAADVVLIGQWARTGRVPTHRVVAASGPAIAAPGYRRVRMGAPIESIVGTMEASTRVIQGTVLSGIAAGADDYLGLGVHTITAIPEGRGDRALFGWARPRLDRPSAWRARLGWLRGARRPRGVDARLHGEPRAPINLGQWRRVMPLDIDVAYLVRAIEADDLDEALDLGLLDLTEEDVALCTFVDPCKTDVGAIIRRGLDLYEREEAAP